MHGRKGFTLIEVLITIVLAAIVMAAAYGVYISQSKGFVTLDQHTQATQNARLALDQLTRELRMAGFGVQGQLAVTDARPSSISFLGDIDSDVNTTLAVATNAGATSIQVDLNDDQDKVDPTDYVFLQNGATVEMMHVATTGDAYSLSGEPDTINLASGLTNAFPASTTLVKTIETTAYALNFGTRTLTKNGVAAATGISNLVFHYYDEFENELVPPTLQSLDATRRAAIRRIDLTLETPVGGNANLTRSYTASVDLRNLGARGFTSDSCPPNAPSSPSITDTATCGHFTVGWTPPTANACDGSPVSDLGGYKVYFGLASGNYYVPAFNISSDTAAQGTVADVRLTNGTRYYVAVSAYDVSFNESAKSGEVSFTLNDTTRPGPPQSLDATASVGSVSLTWQAPTDADAESYRIYRGTTADFAPSSTNMIAGEQSISQGQLAYIDATVNACTTYYYKMSTVDCVGEGTYTAAVYGDGAGAGTDNPVSGQTSTTAAEDPPVSPAAANPFSASGGSQAVQLSWKNPSDPDFDRVMIRYSTSSYPPSNTTGTEAATVTCQPGAQSTYLHGGLNNGQTYFYSLFTCDRCGNCDNVAHAQATPNPLGPIVQLIAPAQGLTITNGQLTFQARAYDPDEGNLSASPNVNTDNGKGIVSVSFAVTPNPMTGQLPLTDSTKEYCGFGGDMDPCGPGDVSQWCSGTYNLSATATDNDGQTTTTPYATIQLRGGGIERDATYVNNLSGTYRQQINFRLTNSSTSDAKLTGITVTYQRSLARLGYVRIPSASTIWDYHTPGAPVNTGEAITFATGSQPTIAHGTTATAQFEFVHQWTTLASPAAVGATQISVASGTGIVRGDVLYVGTTAEVKTVMAISGSTLTLSSALASSHGYGERVSTVPTDNNMPMTGATLSVTINYTLAAHSQVCTTDTLAVSVSAGPVIGTCYQDQPTEDTLMSTTLTQVHVQNYRTVPVHATVADYSGAGIRSMVAYYKVDTARGSTPPTSGFTTSSLTYNSTNSRYEGTIPANVNARMWVYFLATDGNSTTDRSPASGAYSYDLDADTTPPSCPLGLTATVMGSRSVLLQWQKSLETDVAGYNIFRRKNCGTWSKVYTLVSDQNTASPDIIDYTDNDSQNRTGTYCYGYYIEAQDSSGNKSTGCSIYLASAGVCPCP